ncbi:MAG: hypothetical protein ACE5G5_02500 [Candidatus Methylomirabilales bacterium]
MVRKGIHQIGRLPAGKGQGGFSLVDALIGASIFALTLMAMASTFPTAYANVEHGGRRTKAVAIAQEKMEELRAGAFPPSAGGPETVDTIYTRSWTATVTGAPTQVATIGITVSWPEGIRGTKQVSLVSLVAP